MRADNDEKNSHKPHHYLCGEDFAKFGGKRGCDDSSKNQACDEGEIF